MEKTGNYRIQPYVAIILLFYNFVLSQQEIKKKKGFRQKASVNLLKEDIGYLRTTSVAVG
jgi:hypothetical protein